MNRVVKQLTKNHPVAPSTAADQVDQVVYRLLRKLRKGEIAPLPGVGILTPGPEAKLIEEIHGDNTAPRNRRKSR